MEKSQKRKEEEIASKEVFSCPVFRVIETQVRFPDSSTARRWYVVADPWVRAVPLLNDEIVLIREFKSSVQTITWRLPGGRSESGESPTAAVLRELREETGYTAQDIELLFVTDPGASWIRQKGYVFLAKRLKRQKSKTSDETDTIDIVTIPIDKVIEMCDQGKFDIQIEQALRRAVNRIREGG